MLEEIIVYVLMFMKGNIFQHLVLIIFMVSTPFTLPILYNYCLRFKRKLMFNLRLLKLDPLYPIKAFFAVVAKQITLAWLAMFFLLQKFKSEFRNLKIILSIVMGQTEFFNRNTKATMKFLLTYLVIKQKIKCFK